MKNGTLTTVEAAADHVYETYHADNGDTSYGLTADGFSANAWVKSDDRPGHRTVFVHDVEKVELDPDGGGFTIRTKRGTTRIYLITAE